MKTYAKILLAAAAGTLTLAACSREAMEPVQTPQGNLVQVHFGAESPISVPSKATITTEDEATFASAWTNGDVLSVEYSFDHGDAAVAQATWNGSNFEADLTSVTGDWIYYAVYPAPDSDGKTDFGSARTQNGNAYNSKYDLMKGSAVAEGAAAGKTAEGGDIVFPMDRQTAIAYFHLTGSLDEELVSAKLSVEGGSIATSSAVVSMYSNGYTLSDDVANALSEITLTFAEGTAPKASDCKLWFNVLPTIYSKMTLTVETASHTLTLSRTPAKKDLYEAGNLYKVVKEISADKWISKTIAVKDFELVNAAPSDWKGKYILVSVNDSKYYAFDGNKATDSASWGTTSEVKVSDNIIDASNFSLSLEIVAGTVSNSYSIKTQSGKYLSASASRKFNLTDSYSSDNCDFTLSVNDNGTIVILQTSSSNRQIRYNYNSGNGGFRWYDGATANDIYLYKESDTAKYPLAIPTNLSVNSDIKSISWTAVDGAASYKVTIGENTYEAETNSYDASAIEDEYYDVSVVAIPSDTDSYKNSAAATLSAAKFGTPTLKSPALKEGAIDETSVAATWTVDTRATEGYNCEIYNGETKVDSKTVTTGSVAFSSLASGVTYTLKVNAIAVEGDKAYVASKTASISLTTKAANHVSDVTEAGTYTIKNLTVYAVPNTSNAIVGDGTGYLLLYKSSHGLAVGNTIDVAGSIVKYNGVWEFNSPTISNKATGSTPTYSGAVEATESWLTSYETSASVQYIHARGIQSGKNITVGKNVLYLSSENADTDGKAVEIYGFVYGYSSQYSNMNFVATSIEIDNTAPVLSVDKTSKSWAATETDAFVVKVTVNSEGGDWNVTPTTLDWATIAVDKTAGTITVTPKGSNTTPAAYESTLTVTHASDATLTKAISLSQKGAGVEIKSGSVKFGSADGSINANEALASGTDAAGTEWTVTTEGTESFTANSGYSQIGASKSPATSITIVGKISGASSIDSVSVKFGGFNNTAGTISITVVDAEVGTGTLNGNKDVTVSSTKAAVGNVITITVTGISKGVKLYGVDYTYVE